MPLARRYSSARRAMLRGSYGKSWRVSASSVVQTNESVGTSQNGSTKPVSRSGTMTMSPALTRLEADARAVEPDPLLHQRPGEARRRERDVVPAPPEVAELEVHHLDPVIADERLRRFEILEHASSLRAPPTPASPAPRREHPARGRVRSGALYSTFTRSEAVSRGSWIEETKASTVAGGRRRTGSGQRRSVVRAQRSVVRAGRAGRRPRGLQPPLESGKLNDRQGIATWGV